jgi:hypothetical protein
MKKDKELIKRQKETRKRERMEAKTAMKNANSMICSQADLLDSLLCDIQKTPSNEVAVENLHKSARKQKAVCLQLNIDN